MGKRIGSLWELVTAAGQLQQGQRVWTLLGSGARLELQPQGSELSFALYAGTELLAVAKAPAGGSAENLLELVSTLEGKASAEAVDIARQRLRGRLAGLSGAALQLVEAAATDPGDSCERGILAALQAGISERLVRDLLIDTWSTTGVELYPLERAELAMANARQVSAAAQASEKPVEERLTLLAASLASLQQILNEEISDAARQGLSAKEISEATGISVQVVESVIAG